MSEVNQAFLRAYLKNRTAQPPQASNEQPGNVQAISTPVQQSVRPMRPEHRTLPPATQSTQSTHRSIPSGASLRLDPSHRQPSQTPMQPITDDQPDDHPAYVPSQPVAPRQGVWSPLGVERGMKSMESMSVPAVVRNGVEAVPSNSTQNRTVSKVSSRGADVAADMPYDQVMYVDGLEGHSASHRKSSLPRTERTLAEITEPIAFGTGSPAPTPTPHAKRPPAVSAPAIPLPADFAPETYSPHKSASSHSDTTRMRFDAPHTTQSRLVTPPLPVQPPTPSNEISRNAPEPKARDSKSVEAKSAEGKAAFVPVPFSPSWEVDCFFWPEVIKQIEASHGDAFRQIGKHLSLANRDGLKVMAITSGERGVGRSTVAMHMARCAASAGLRVALVDGDTFCPSLVDQLRLDMEHGWQDCLFENVPLHEAAIHSITDGITLFPLTSVVSPQQMHVNLLRISKLIKRISNAYDMVFIDANRLNLEQRDMAGVSQETIVDAAIVVVDTELSIKEKVDSAVSILQSMGLSSIGLVENFQS